MERASASQPSIPTSAPFMTFSSVRASFTCEVPKVRREVGPVRLPVSPELAYEDGMQMRATRFVIPSGLGRGFTLASTLFLVACPSKDGGKDAQTSSSGTTGQTAPVGSGPL